MPDEKQPNDLDLTLEALEDDQSETGSTAVGDEARSDAPPESILEGLEIPPELQPFAQKIEKQIKAGYTPKFQEAARLRKEAEAALKEVPALQYKAEVLDRLYQNPQIAQIVNTILSGTDPAALESGEEDSEDPEVEAVRRVVAPLQQEIAQLKQRQQQTAVQTEINEFFSKHPNWEQEVGREGMDTAWKRNPYLSMEDAYGLAVYAKAQARKQAAVKTERAAVEKGGTSRTTQAPPKIESLYDAYKAAIREHGVKGEP